jgi:DNA polymerase-3 subunit delta'
MERPTDLPDTIKSRCSLVRFKDLSARDLGGLLQERLGADPAAAHLAVQLARGSLTQAAALIEEDVLALRNEAVDLATVEGGGAEHHEKLEALIRGKDRGRIELIFDLLLLWYRDLLRCGTGGADTVEGYANADRVSDLEEWSRRLSHADLSESIEKVEEARDALRGYGYLPLVIYSLLEQLPRGSAQARR